MVIHNLYQSAIITPSSWRCGWKSHIEISIKCSHPLKGFEKNAPKLVRFVTGSCLSLEMGYDVQVIAQAIVYFAIVFLNFAVSIPLGITTTEFHQECTLYNTFSFIGKNIQRFNSNIATCNYPIYAPVILMFYAVVVGGYHMYAACKSKDPNVGRQMWVLPFVLFNGLASFLMLVVCCIISVGLKNSCDNFTKLYNDIVSCAFIETIKWTNVDHDNHYYRYPRISEIAGWITFLVWIAQLSLSILRFVRNHRTRLTPAVSKA